jgi:hypothetical protein
VHHAYHYRTGFIPAAMCSARRVVVCFARHNQQQE